MPRRAGIFTITDYYTFRLLQCRVNFTHWGGEVTMHCSELMARMPGDRSRDIDALLRLYFSFRGLIIRRDESAR